MPIHRLFVGNVPAGTSEQELKQEFSNYGSVKAIDLKCKPNALNGSVDTFAFVNVELDDRTLWQCINEFRQEQYKGVYLNVSKAKESFLDRLKREREEAEAAKQNSEALNPYKKAQEHEPVKKITEALPVLPTIAKQVESSSSESSSEDESPAPPPVRRSAVAIKKPQVDDEDQLVRKWNQETYIEHGKLKIVSITGQVKEVIDKSKNRNQQSGKELDEKAKLADEKRKQGLTNLQSAYEQQKSAIQAALAGGGDGAKRKKIVFDDDDDDQAGKKPKISLFGDEDGEDGFKANFTVRKQLAENTEKGQQLFDMQTQFHGDSRFKLDERFLADDTAAGRKKRMLYEREKATMDKSGVNVNNQERKKQMEILSKVTGRDIYDREQFKKDNVGAKGMQRFDPSAKKEVPVKKEKILTEEEILEAKRAERPEEVFQVTEDKFFKVSDGLSHAIGANSGGFSLLSTFGPAVVENAEEENDQEQPLDKPMYSDARFRYESSASEDEDEKPEKAVETTAVVPEEEATKKKKKKSGYLSKQGIWKENFFFLPNDARFEEGRKFFLEFASSAAEANASKGDQAKDIRKIFKKRRMRETKNVNQMRAKRGLKLMKGKRK
ncbi:probable RNA-binding protein CG14230 [Ochlerotatus camptorhynchus]|uniref:probable RNA-binding protein CG14230 n=1 Tax=Ochlerotatus camptorhynchus TaxID=644619 RepID=UPI0031D40511